MEQGAKCYIFENIFDALAYLVISAIMPLTYTVADFIKVFSNRESTMIATSVTLLSFFASYAYDYASRYFDDSETKKRMIYNTLFVGMILYALISLVIFVFIILIAIDISWDGIYLIYFVFFIIGFYAPIVSLIEVIRRLIKIHKNKLARAINV